MFNYSFWRFFQNLANFQNYVLQYSYKSNLLSIQLQHQINTFDMQEKVQLITHTALLLSRMWKIPYSGLLLWGLNILKNLQTP